MVNQRLLLDLFPDRIVELQGERLEQRGPSAYTIFGTVVGEPGASFALVVQEEAVAATIRLPGEALYRLRSIGDGLHAIDQIDDHVEKSCGTVGTSASHSGGVFESVQPTLSQAMDDGSEVDVVVVYTPAVLQAEGGISGLLASVTLGAANANIAFENSGIATKLRIVHVGEVPYTESADIRTDLNRLEDGTSGLAIAHTLRDQFCADIVTLLVDDLDPDTLGVAKLLDTPRLPPFDFAPLAINVVEAETLGATATFAHEVGHNLGAHHDRQNACRSGPCFGICCAGDATKEQDQGAYDHSYGFRVPDSYRTIMGASTGCSSCPRILLFSDPSLTHDGVNAGVAGGHPNGANNALTLNLNRGLAANWRLSCVVQDPPDLGISPPAQPGDRLVTNLATSELFRVDAHGNRGVLSSNRVGSGPPLNGIRGISIGGDGQILVALFAADGRLIRIDPETGDRTTLSGCTNLDCSTIVGMGPAFPRPFQLVATPGRGALASFDQALLEVDGATGDRTVVSGCADPACSARVGTGRDYFFGGIAFEANGDIVSVGLREVVRIDPNSGNRSVISGCLDDLCTSSLGTGPAFEFAEDIVVESDGQMLVSDRALPAIFRVDPETGDRTILSGCAQPACSSFTGTGPPVGGIRGISLEADGNLLFADPALGATFRMDAATGDRTVVSGCVDNSCSAIVGSGPNLAFPYDVAVVPAPSRTLAIGTALAVLMVTSCYSRDSILRRRRKPLGLPAAR